MYGHNLHQFVDLEHDENDDDVVHSDFNDLHILDFPDRFFDDQDFDHIHNHDFLLQLFAEDARLLG